MIATTTLGASLTRRINAARAAELRAAPIIESTQNRVDQLHAEVRERAVTRARLLIEGTTPRDLVKFDRETVERQRAIEVADQALRDAHRLAGEARKEREDLELERRAAIERVRATREWLRAAPIERARIEYELSEARQRVAAFERRLSHHQEHVAGAEAAVASLVQELDG